jgi:hypothetical protein
MHSFGEVVVGGVIGTFEGEQDVVKAECEE